MGTVDNRYEQLRPEIDLLRDPAVLLQAWKKSDTYIRRHNWYSDVLALERASVALPLDIEEWASHLATGTFKHFPMRLVPAPKNSSWHFPAKEAGDQWCFKVSKSQPRQKIRPLAHVGIREQTVATAAMLCLADAVETEQGPTDHPDYRSAQLSQTFSYGNRLFCDWLDDKKGRKRAHHRWGSSNTYSQFFQDYQRFLQRPAEVCEDWESRSGKRRLFVIKLDLSQFYDRIDRHKLVDEVKRLYSSYARRHDREHSRRRRAAFWAKLRQVVAFTWEPSDRQAYSDLFEDEQLPDGLPQGLVASGFFANAYLHRFDQDIGRRIESGRSIGRGLRLLDYCRYVDDLRLVVSQAPTQSSADIRKWVSKWINKLLERYCDGLDATHQLKVNADKTEVVAWEDFAVRGRMSEYMRAVQRNISVVPDVETLQQTTSSLNNLLWLSDALREVDSDTGNDLALSRIAVPQLDVRDDTIKRFAAHRLQRVLAQRRSMAVVEREEEDSVSDDRRSLDHEMETTARRLIACWARNPALVTVLRCGLEMFPSVHVLEPVLEALDAKLGSGSREEQYVAQFVLADLLRAGATETGFKEVDAYPNHADVDGYRSALKSVALKVLSDASLPWYLHQQAAIFLAVMRHAADIPGHKALRACLTKL